VGPKTGTSSAAVAKDATTRPVKTRRPLHDTLRLGLPVGRLTSVPEAPAESTLLLVAAAVLLAGAAFGGCVIGVVARRLAEPA
jgi:hypothetical protein